MKQLLSTATKSYRHCIGVQQQQQQQLFKSTLPSRIPFITHQLRCQSTTTSATQESNNPTTTEEEEVEAVKKPFVFPIDEERIGRLSLNLVQAKDAQSQLATILESEEYTKRLSQISSMSNETELFSKFSLYLSLMVSARAKVITQFPVISNSPKIGLDKDQAIRTNIGKWSLKDEELLGQVRLLHSKLAKQVFNVDLPDTHSLMPDRIALNIHMQAQSSANRVVYEEYSEAALTTPKDGIESFMRSVHVPLVFKFEMEQLKEQEQLMAISKKKKVLYDKYMKMLREDVKSVSTAQWEERAAISFEELTLEDERFVLATPAGWIAMKFQIADCLYRLG